MTTAERPLRWGIMGCGRIANDFVLALSYASHPHVVTAVAESYQTDGAESFRRRLGLSAAVRVYDSYDALIADPNIDIIYIATLNRDHHEWTLKALAARKPVLCEKPLGVTSAEVRQMTVAARRNETFLMEGFWSRFFPAWQHIEKVIESKKYGEVRYCSANFGIVADADRLYPPTCETPYMDVGVYTVMFAMFVNLGRGAPKRIHVCGQKHDNGSDLWANITLDFGDNVHALCSYNGTAWGSNSAFIAFERGQIQIPEFFWAPTRLIEFETPARAGHSTPITHDFPLGERPADASRFVYNNGPGMHYEADHVFECLRRGETESDVLPLDATIRLHETLERVRHEIGVSLAQDNATEQ